jgi:hypothetical protein
MYMNTTPSAMPFSVAMKNLVKAIVARHSGMQEIKDPYGL